MTYKRVLIKLSGEVLGFKDGWGVEGAALMRVVAEMKALVKKKVQVAVVVGGGNFWRYRDNKTLTLPRSSSDTIGMMATIMNARLLADALTASGVEAYALAAHGEFYFAEPYVPERGRKLLDCGAVVICAGGTGNPYFTTDTAAALRALELGCEVLLKGTKVEGVYDADPTVNKKAKLFPKISYDEVLKRELQVMDLTSIVLCKENRLPIHVYNGRTPGNLAKVVSGKKMGTLIS